MIFTAAERAFLDSQLLGRLATVDPDGAPQNNPVGFFLDDETGDVVIGGRDLEQTRKFRNVRHNANVALVVDDLVSTNPWTPRGVEIRGTAEAIADTEPPRPGYSPAVIRIKPQWVGSWGVEPDAAGLHVHRAA